MLYRDVCGWFEKVSRGIYGLSPRGRREVNTWHRPCFRKPTQGRQRRTTLMHASIIHENPAGHDSKPRVYLNSIQVRSRAEPELLQTFYSEDCSEIAGIIRARLVDLIRLPHVSTVSGARSSDLALDILVPDFVTAIRVYDMRFRLFHIDPRWRPTLTLAARLNRLISGEVVEQVSITESIESELRWRDLLSPRAIRNDRVAHRQLELDRLLSGASMALVDRLREAV